MTSLVIKAGMKQGGFTDAQREVTVPSFQSVMLEETPHVTLVQALLKHVISMSGHPQSQCYSILHMKKFGKHFFLRLLARKQRVKGDPHFCALLGRSISHLLGLSHRKRWHEVARKFLEKVKPW